MTVLESLRRDYHRQICATILGHRPNSTVYSIADSASATSRALSERLIAKIGLPTCTNPPVGQSAGKYFTDFTRVFLEQAFACLGHVRPGEWVFSVSQANQGITAYDQYAHLADLDRLARENLEVKAVLGADYLITPDIVIARRPVPDADLNRNPDEPLVGDDGLAALTPLRAANNSAATLHASVSCKWTMRSDRAQNSRTEALNLIRNRKGKTPHIVAVTFEPMPTRLASIALGTGDIDCTYHAALPELEAAVRDSGNEDQREMLDVLVQGRRLRDIGDLPFDLAM